MRQAPTFCGSKDRMNPAIEEMNISVTRRQHYSEVCDLAPSDRGMLNMR